jgi:hypothetical protein
MKRTAADAYRAEVAATPAAEKARARGLAAAKTDGETLRLVNHRRPFEMLDELPKAQMRQLRRLTRLNGAGKPSNLVHDEDWAPMQLVDVLDVATKTVTHQLYIWPYGCGALFDHGTVVQSGTIIQHGLQQKIDDIAFRRALAAAYAMAKPALAEVVDFDLDEKPDPMELERAAEAKLARTYERLAQLLGPSDEKYRDFDALTDEQQKAIRDAFRTVLVEPLAARGLASLGFPPVVRMRSWCDHSPRGPLESRAGKWPVWKWLKQATLGNIDEAEAIDAITRALPPDRVIVLAHQICQAFFDYDLWGQDLYERKPKPISTPVEKRTARFVAALVRAVGPDAPVKFARAMTEVNEDERWLMAAVASYALESKLLSPKQILERNDVRSRKR